MRLRSILFVCSLLTTASLFAQQTSKIYVDMGSRGYDIPRQMYGIFFEEINHAGDGGLYAEMIQNRGFEEHVYPSGMTYNADLQRVEVTAKNYYGLDQVTSWVHWKTEERKWTGWEVSSSGCTLTKDIVEQNSPLHENTPHALRLNISGATASAKVNVDNTGYWGVSAKAQATYKLRFYLRTSDYEGSVTAQLVNASGKAIASKSFSVNRTGEWTEYTATLTANEAMSGGRFRLQFTAAGQVDVDYVSLFPTDTYKGRENGLRRDIAETLEQMRPQFMRWPGGCIVEGICLDNRVKWKETLGDPMTRRGEYSLWDYRSTYGLGLYEFLQMCEDMGMDGMFVGNVGISCSLRSGQFVEPDDEESLLPYRQDIEDAIEFAIGDPATNEWAAKRAEMGHPAPFPLKYVELGNENGTARYSLRYGFFYDYLKQKYPQLTFINTLTWWDNGEFGNYAATDMLDVHWYVTPDEFYNSATLFENAFRGNKTPGNDYTIYAGEYAANGNVGQGNMDAALAEAAFIGYMERNSDFVQMASYAPLLTNENRQNWFCNLIHYDNDAVWGRASYYVQTMYAQNRPDYNVKTRLYSNAQNLLTRGRIGLGTWATQAEFRNVKVMSNDGTKTYYDSDFAGRPNEWTEKAGTWDFTSDNTYKQTGLGTPCYSMMNGADFTDCTIEFEAKKTGGAEGFLLFFGCDADGKNGYRINIGGWGNSATALEKLSGGHGAVMGDKVNHRLNNNQWYRFRLEMKEAQSLTLYTDDKVLLSQSLYDLENGRLQAVGGYDQTAGELVVKVVNAIGSPTTSTIRVNANNVQATGKVITLQADQLTDENDKANPTRIAPVETTFGQFAEEFTYTFPANSFTIFRIKADASAPAPLTIPAYEWDDTPVTNNEATEQIDHLSQQLNTLIGQAERLCVEGSAGANTFASAIAQAKETVTTAPLTIKDLQQGIQTLQAATDNYVAGLMKEQNELTSKIKSPNFSTGTATGWSGNLPAIGFHTGEFFNTNFDMYQTVTALQPGQYLVYVQGFYRDGDWNIAPGKHSNGTSVSRPSSSTSTRPAVRPSGSSRDRR